MRRSEIQKLEGAAINEKGLQYCLLLAYKWYTNRQKKSLFHGVWVTKPFGRVYEIVFGHQGGQPKVLYRYLQ